jgi:hypothetical protein
MNFKDEALEVLRKLDYFGPDATVIVEKALRDIYIAGLHRAAQICEDDSQSYRDKSAAALHIRAESVRIGPT